MIATILLLLTLYVCQINGIIIKYKSYGSKHTHTRFLNKTVAFIWGISILAFIFHACNLNTQNDSLHSDLHLDQELVTYFEHIGTLHNELLDDNYSFLENKSKVEGKKLTFDSISEVKSYDLVFESIYQNMINKYDFDESEINVNGKELAFNHFYEIASYKMVKDKANAFASDFTSVIAYLEAQQEIPDYSVEVFTKLSEIATTNHSDISEALDLYLNEQIEAGASLEKIHFILLCNSITKNSLEYWDEHLKSVGFSPQQKAAAIPAWAIADIGGSIIGGGSAIIMQLDQEEINWWKVGGNALWVGAASSGLRWLMK